jgi:hypothetical protein
VSRGGTTVKRDLKRELARLRLQYAVLVSLAKEKRAEIEQLEQLAKQGEVVRDGDSASHRVSPSLQELGPGRRGLGR